MNLFIYNYKNTHKEKENYKRIIIKLEKVQIMLYVMINDFCINNYHKLSLIDPVTNPYPKKYINS